MKLSEASLTSGFNLTLKSGKKRINEVSISYGNVLFESRSVTADIPQGSILEPFKSNQNIFYSIKLQYT